MVANAEQGKAWQETRGPMAGQWPVPARLCLSMGFPRNRSATGHGVWQARSRDLGSSEVFMPLSFLEIVLE